jgi:uncharacterized protein DUF1552
MTPMSRRTLLRGAGGVAVALPFLDAMWSPRTARAATAPNRLLINFTENGVVEPNWYPTGDVKNFSLASSMQSFEPWKNNLILFEGIDQMGDGSNGGGGHQRGKTGCLTAQPNLNGRAFGISIDQLIANQIGTASRFKSIQASVFVKGTLRDGLIFSGPSQMVVPEDSPSNLFTQLFSGPLPTPAGAAVDPAAKAEFERLRGKKQSILDRTLDEYQRISAQVGPADRARLGVHMDAIRSVERSLDAVSGVASASCKKPDPPAAGGFVETGKAQMDLVTLALACDLTRVASLQWRSSVTAFTWVNVNSEHHGLSHQQGSPGADAQLSRINKWFVDQAAYMLGRLRSFSDVGGTTLFDNTLFFWPNELATGRHRRTHAPYVFATGKFNLPTGKVLETGRYLKYPGGTPHSSLLTTVGQMMGLDITNFGAQQWQQGPLKNVI